MYKSLQTCRAVAAMLVVMYHLSEKIAKPKFFDVPDFRSFVSFGHAGVDLFFVLSGFIIVAAHRNDIDRPAALLPYLYKRAIRIFPVYWVAFALIYAAGQLYPGAEGYTVANAEVLAKALLLLPQDVQVVGGTGAPVVGVAWTLHYELLFYLCFACAIVSRWLLFPVLGFLALNQWHCHAGGCGFPMSFFGFWPALYCFTLGALIAFLAPRLRLGKRAALACAGAGAALFLAEGLMESYVYGQPGPHANEIFGLASFMVVLGLVLAERRGFALGDNRVMQSLGDASYSIYLLHAPMLGALLRLATHLFERTESGAAGGYLFVLCCALGICVAFYRGVEKPMLSQLRRYTPRQHQPSSLRPQHERHGT